jgi:hypothetical protein
MTKIAEIAVHINETKRLVDRVADLLAIQARLAGSLPSDVDLFIAGSLYSPHRRLVREGDLISKKEKKRKHYLFNDCLLWTNSHEKYKSHIAMRNVEVGQVDAVDGQDFSTAFQLTTHIPTIDGFKVGEKIVLFCSSTYEKDGWLKDLEAAIDEAEEAASAHASANGLSGVVLPTRVRRMSDMNKAANAARESSKSVQMDSVTEVASPESSSTNTSVAEPAETTPKSTPTKPNGRAMSSGGGKLERTNSLTGGKFHDRSPSHGSATRLSGKPNDRAPSIGSASKLNGRTNSDSLRNSLGVTSPDPPRAVSPALAARLSTSRRGSTQPPAKEGRESPAVMEAVPIQQEAPVEPTPAAAAAPASSSSSSKPAVAAAAPTALSPSRIPRIDVSAAPAEPQEPATPDSPSTAAQKEWSRASQAMYRISRSDLTGLKSMKTPVPNLKCAMEALGCLVGAGDLPGSGAANGATTPRGSSAKRSNLHTADDWTSLHALLVKPNFLTILREFNERQAPVTERADKKIASLVDIPTMSEASITKASPAVGVLWTWVLSYWKLKKVNGQDAVFMPPATPSSLPRPSSARLSLFEKPSVSAGPSATPRTSGASKLAPQTPRGGAGASPAPSPTSRPASASIYRIHRKNTSSVSSVSSITSNMSTLSTQSEAVGGSRSSRGNLASLATSSTSRGPGSSTTRVGGVKITLISGRPLSAAVSTTPSVPKENLPLPPFSELVKCKTQFNQDRMVNYYHPPTKTFYEAHVSAPVDFFLLEGPKLAKVKVSEAAHAARLKAAASPKRPKEGENAPPPSTFGKSESRAVTPAPESNGSAAGSGSRLPTSRASTTHEIKAKLPASASSSSSSTSGSSSSKKKHIVSVKPASSTEVKPSTSRSSSLKKHRLSSALPAKKEGE